MNIIAIANQKGGTGKTTTAAALAQAAAYRGRNVLVIDLDPQSNLSYALGADLRQGSAYDLLTGTPAADLVQHCGGLDVIPAAWTLQTITSTRGSARRLQAALMPIKEKYALTIIDTPPTAGELQYNALQAAEGLIIPLQADTFSLSALYQMADTARQIRRSNPALRILGYILTQYDGRSIIARQMRENIERQAQAAGIPFLQAIRPAVAVKEAAALQQSLYEYAPRCKPAADYLALYDTIMGGE